MGVLEIVMRGAVSVIELGLVQVERVWKKTRKTIANKKKAKLIKVHNEFDPFKEIARNGGDIAMYAYGNSVYTCTFSALDRVMTEHRSLGKTPICIYIGRDPEGIEQREKDTNMRMIQYKFSHSVDILKTTLRIHEDLSKEQSKNTVVYLTHSNICPGRDVEAWHSFILPILISNICLDPNSICLVVIPYANSYRNIPNLLEEQRKTLPDLTVQYVYPTSYEHSHTTSTYFMCPNKILFPMYLYKFRRNNVWVDMALQILPHSDSAMLTKCFWDYHQAIYDVDGTTGTYFMDAIEITGEK